MSGTVALLVINPNSTASVTDGLRAILPPPPGTTLEFYTAPPSAPSAISDATTGVLSAAACLADLTARGLLDAFDGFLVCCFSDHPLTHLLREASRKPTLNILEGAIAHALLVGQRFGIVTSGAGYKYAHYTEVRNVLGAPSERFAGVVACGVAVLEFQGGARDVVEAKVKAASARSAAQGADVIILGCAGMAGMEPLVHQGVAEAGLGPVRVVDGAKAGVQILAGLARLDKET
ncbi:hypothetical protein HYPSUDRAFT_138538 [Hypholoma sublateritium FD-334 SS-4]|uniref:Asp/Glu/hydantoin racemase n=1 Tax=Hypholoma sublateritium (strain FD-334 SS-4) TaxID=945553 RepID=A0A0D2PT99_HYPSF|nr:hypothetical protein HYPSUDRAFT_138538 [Hypholoma sublateritium FD-334 SS-4]